MAPTTPSLETRQVRALEAIAERVTRLNDPPPTASALDVFVNLLACQAATAAAANAAATPCSVDHIHGPDCRPTTSAFTGWPALGFTVEHTADPDDIDRHITVKITSNDSGVYVVFTESGDLLEINTTKWG